MTEITIGNRYILQEELGSGGMGTVYLAQDTSTQEQVAVKALKSDVAQAEMIERFKREGEALRDLNHPNIVKMLDAFEHEGQHYLVMEYVSGGDLSDLLTQGQVPLEKLLNLSIDLADALTRAHRLNIIHRDLKPANVLIGDDSVLQLTDFGVAHVGSKERVTDTDAIIGTIDYLPPEAFSGVTFDARGDIWAFGVILFEMLAGERPFKGDTLFEVIQAITMQPIPDLEALRPDCPIGLIDLVYRMLERNPQARIPSVRVVGTELEAILEGRDQAVAIKRFDTPLPDYSTRPKHNLPAQATPFVGREHELDELNNLLKDSTLRLITILAQGGMGKTRLVLELAQHAVDQNLYPDGVYFVELAPLSGADNIPNAIADAAGFQFLGEGTPKEQLLTILEDRNLLLVMDNYEHLPDGFALVGDIIKSAPNVYIIATSRQRLSQAGETLFHLSGMDFPEWETPDDALEYAAIKLLFMNSAKRVQPDFDLTDDNLDVIARICKLVQGMPLGIVLAASWLAVLSLSEIADEIQQSLDFLQTDETDLPERQRSIRAVMDYSWGQMTKAEQQVFMKLSVFRGGFTREAAQAVAGANLRILMSLVNKSLIRRNVNTGRYEIHELLRQFAEEQLDRSGEGNTIEDAHGTYFSMFMQARAPEIKGHNQVTAMDAVDADLDNIRVAWLWTVDRKYFDRLDPMIEGLFWYRNQRGRYNEVFEQAWKQLAPLPNENPHPVAMKMFVRIREFRHAAIEDIQQGLEVARQSGDITEILFCEILLSLSLLDNYQDIPQAMQLLENNLVNYHDVAEPFYIAYIYGGLGQAHNVLGNQEDCLKNFLLFIEQMKMIGNQIQVAWNLFSIAIVEDYEPNQLHEALNVFQRTKVPSGASLVLISLGIAELIHNSDIPQASNYFQQGLNIALDITFGHGLAQGYANLSVLASMLGDYDRALQLAQKGTHFSQDTFNQIFINTAMGMATCGLGDFDIARKYLIDNLQRLNMPRDLDIGAVLLAQAGKSERAVELLGAQTLCSLGFRLDQWELLNRLKADLKAELGAEAYQVAWERGKSLDLETVIQDLIAEFSEDA